MSDDGEECDCNVPIDQRDIKTVFSCKECRGIFLSMHQFYLHFQRSCAEDLNLSETDEETGAQVDSSKEDSTGENEMNVSLNGACVGREGSSIIPALSTAQSTISNDTMVISNVAEQDKSTEKMPLDKEAKPDPPSAKEMLREMQKKLEEKAAASKQCPVKKYNLRRR